MMFSKFLRFSFCLIVFAVFLSPLNVVYGANYTFYPSSEATGGTYFFIENAEPGLEYSSFVTLKLIDPTITQFEIKAKRHSSVDDIESWVSFPDGKIIEVDESTMSVDIPFIINIPEIVTPGDHVLSFVIGESNSGESDAMDDGGAGLSIQPGLGIKMYFKVPGEISHSVDLISFDVKEFLYGEDSNILILFLESMNKGNVILTPFVDIDITDSSGAILYQETFELQEAYPYKSNYDELKINNEVFNVIFGFFDVNAKLYYEYEDNVYDFASAKTRLSIIPWRLIFIILAFIVVSILYLFYVRFRFSRLASNSKLYIVKQGDTLQSLANNLKVNHKDIIILNKLKSPYFIKVGSKLYIPNKNNTK